MSRSEGELLLSVAVSPFSGDKERPSDMEPLIRATVMEKSLLIRSQKEDTCFEANLETRIAYLEEFGWTK
jgi:hypothetical protein